MNQTDALAATAEEARLQRERRTALATALRELVRDGGEVPSNVVNAWLAKFRTDGTAATFRAAEPDAREPRQTNHADHVTSGYLPLSNRED